MHSIFLGPQAERFLYKTDKALRQRIWEKLDELKLNPFPREVEQVLGKKEKSFRVRIGKYRIQYVVLKDVKQVVVFDIDKREKAYD